MALRNWKNFSKSYENHLVTREVKHIQECKVGEMKTEHQQTLNFYKLNHFLLSSGQCCWWFTNHFEKGQRSKMLDQDQSHQNISANDRKLTVDNFVAISTPY